MAAYEPDTQAPLRPPHSAAGPVVYLRRTESTNDRSRDLVASGAPNGTVVVADEQTSGRGRLGRAWVTAPRRTLALSIVVRPFGPEMSLLPFAAALAVCEGCERCAPVQCRIKWPNDVWIDGLKVAGILIESRPREGWAVVGIGVNANLEDSDLPAELRSVATSLRIAAGMPILRDELLDTVLTSFSRWLATLQGGHRITLLDAYRQRDALRGARIAWTADAEQRAGVAEGIDANGNLLTTLDTGEQVTLRAGEVHLLRR